MQIRQETVVKVERPAVQERENDRSTLKPSALRVSRGKLLEKCRLVGQGLIVPSPDIFSSSISSIIYPTRRSVKGKTPAARDVKSIVPKTDLEVVWHPSR